MWFGPDSAYSDSDPTGPDTGRVETKDLLVRFVSVNMY